MLLLLGVYLVVIIMGVSDVNEDINNIFFLFIIFYFYIMNKYIKKIGNWVLRKYLYKFLK